MRTESRECLRVKKNRAKGRIEMVAFMELSISVLVCGYLGGEKYGFISDEDSRVKLLQVTIKSVVWF